MAYLEPVIQATALLAVVIMAGVALRHAVRIGQHEARCAAAEATAAAAAAAAARAEEAAARAEDYASKRADAVYAQYQQRERQERRRGRAPETDEQSPSPVPVFKPGCDAFGRPVQQRIEGERAELPAPGAALAARGLRVVDGKLEATG